MLVNKVKSLSLSCVYFKWTQLHLINELSLCKINFDFGKWKASTSLVKTTSSCQNTVDNFNLPFHSIQSPKKRKKVHNVRQCMSLQHAFLCEWALTYVGAWMKRKMQSNANITSHLSCISLIWVKSSWSDLYRISVTQLQNLFPTLNEPPLLSLAWCLPI